MTSNEAKIGHRMPSGTVTNSDSGIVNSEHFSKHPLKEKKKPETT